MNSYLILLIDDEEAILNSLARALKCDGYEILTRKSAEDAMGIVTEKEINLIICDYKLPGMNGIDFLEKVAEINPDIVPVLLTGQADVRIASEAVNRLSLAGFITKPWDNGELRSAVKDSLERLDKRALVKIRAEDIMSKFAITIQEDAPLLEAAHLMMRFKVSGLPVLSGKGDMTGIITATDLFRIMGETAADLLIPPGYAKVKGVMVKQVYTVNRETPFFKIINIMCSKRIHTLPVVENDEIIGVVGRRDVFNHYYRLVKKASNRQKDRM